MNRYLSVFGLSARSTLYKLIGVIIIMAVVQAGMFLYTLNNAEGSILLENLIDKSKIAFAFGLGFLGYYMILCGVSKNTSNAAMTMHRLSIPDGTANWIAVIYNIMALIIFLAAELAICLALSQIYLNSDVSGSYQHVLFTAFYRSDLLHTLLPLEDYVTLASDIIYVLALSIIAAYIQQQERRSKRNALGYSLGGVLAGIAIAGFLQDSANPDMIGATIAGLFAVYAAVCISKGGAVDEDTVYTEQETEQQNI